MIRSCEWHGTQAVEFTKRDYTALLVPSVGANLVRLAHTRLGVEVLRTPSEREHDEFLRRPHVYGVPILFPPNRIADGRFRFDGREYRFPITRPEENNYHHGILKSQPFAVSKAVETPDEVLIETRCYSNAASDAIYRDFPHAFKCKITYRLSAEGLEQEVMFGNKSDLPMPVGVGFHTPLNVPFAGGDAADYQLRMAVGERFELNGRNLPTGRLLPLDERFARLRAPEGLQATGCEAIEAGFLEQRRAGALLLSRAAVVGHRCAESARPRTVGIPLDPAGRQVVDPLPVVCEIIRNTGRHENRTRSLSGFEHGVSFGDGAVATEGVASGGQGAAGRDECRPEGNGVFPAPAVAGGVGRFFRSDRRRMGGVRSGTVCRRTTRGRTADRVDGAAPCGLRGVVYTLYRDRMAVRRRGLGAGLCHRSGAGRAARCLRPVGTAAGVLLYGGGEPSFGAGDAAVGDAQPRRIRSSGLARRASPAAACALCGCTGYFRGTIFR